MNIEASSMDELIEKYTAVAESVSEVDPDFNDDLESVNNHYTWLGVFVSFARDMTELRNKGVCKQHDEAKAAKEQHDPQPNYKSHDPIVRIWCGKHRAYCVQEAMRAVPPIADRSKFAPCGHPKTGGACGCKGDSDDPAEHCDTKLCANYIGDCKLPPWQHLVTLQGGGEARPADVADSYGLSLTEIRKSTRHDLVASLLEKWRDKLDLKPFVEFERFLNDQPMSWIRVFFAYEGCELLAEVNKEG